MAFYVCKNKKKMGYAEQALQSEAGAKQHTLQPITTGASVVGLVFKDGVIIGSDRAISYGSMSRYSNIQRVHKITDECAFAASGEYADF